MARGYLGQTNGVDLFRSSITVDDFTTSGVRTVHFVLLQDHLNLIKSQMDRPGGELWCDFPMKIRCQKLLCHFLEQVPFLDTHGVCHTI